MDVRGLRYEADGIGLIKDISFTLESGTRTIILGHNGAGKSTVLRIMAGLDEPTNGDVWVQPNAKIGYLSQEPELDDLLPIDGNGQWSLQLTPVNEGDDPPERPDWFGYRLI